MRDRLIELLKGAETKVTEMISTPLALEEWLGVYANYLLTNGVIVPPCKVGDKVHKIIPKCTAPSSLCPYSGGYGTSRCGKGDENCNAYIEVIPFTLSLLDRMNVDVFLTKEEAEQALKGGVQE